jgi:hypothetical protein
MSTAQIALTYIARPTVQHLSINIAIIGLVKSTKIIELVKSLFAVKIMAHGNLGEKF